MDRLEWLHLTNTPLTDAGLEQLANHPSIKTLVIACSAPLGLDQYASQYWPSQERPPMPKRRRRTFTPEFKAQVVLEVLSGLRSQAEVARRHKLKPELIARWKDIALEGLESLFQGDGQQGQNQERTAELERMVGRLTMELEVAKKASALLPLALRPSGRSS
jgi:transposase